MKRYLVSGSIQGRGMDADKFYAINEVVEGENIDQAQATAEQNGIWVERVVFLEELETCEACELNKKYIADITREGITKELRAKVDEEYRLAGAHLKHTCKRAGRNK